MRHACLGGGGASGVLLSKVSVRTEGFCKALLKNMESVPLIPLKVLLGNPVYSSAKVSPDGRYISYLKPSADKDVLNVWIRPSKRHQASANAKGDSAVGDKMVTSDRHRGIRLYTWSEDSKHIFYLQDKDGDENWHLFAQAIDAAAAPRELTPFKNVRADNLITDPNFPDTVLVGLNKRDARVFDMYRLSLTTGDLTLDTGNPGDVLSWYADAELNIRGAVSMNPADGSKTLRIRSSTASEWYDLVTWPQDEEGAMIGFAKDGKSVYVTSSLGSDTTQLQQLSTAPSVATSVAGGATSQPPAAVARPSVIATLAGSAECDVGQVLVDKLTKVPQAVGFNYLRNKWKVLDQTLQADFELLSSFKGADADASVESRSTDNSLWVVAFTRDNAPVEYYLYDRTKAAEDERMEFLFENQPALKEYKLSRKHPVCLKARDGVTLPSYLTLPPLPSSPASLLPLNPDDPAWQSVASLKLPLVLFVHGGPWARDSWGLDATAQWFSNRGYAVLQVNYRASTGYGKKFLHLGEKQWGIGAMQHDLTDAVNWAIKAGVADSRRIAIYGGSYGGYACLAGLAFTPDLFCCGVDIVGPSHIRTLFESIPPYWAPMKRLLIDRVGDVEGDGEMNNRISPYYHASSIKAPLIIAQGANDPRVKKAESDQIYTALSDKGLEAEYFLYTDEGHGFARPPNRLDFCSKVDQFLAKHLQGRAESPLKLKGTSVVAMHKLASLEDYHPAGSNKGRTAAAVVGAGVAAAAAAAAGVAAAGGKFDRGRRLGLAVGVPATILAGAAASVVVVLRGLSPRK